MKDTLESLRHKIEMAKELNSVVRTMKALSASSINQYEKAYQSLEDYYRTVKLGLYVCLVRSKVPIELGKKKGGKTGAIIFGSGQGLVGQFNDVLCQFVAGKMEQIKGEKIIWSVGASLQGQLEDLRLPPTRLFEVPHTVKAITPLVGQLLFEIENAIEKEEVSEIFLFYNRPQSDAIYGPECLRFAPLDEIWLQELITIKWPSPKIPETIYNPELTLKALVREYFFVALFRASAESLASENASRLAAMQRAEKNIKDQLNDLTLSYHQLRQSSIDEEMFDVIFGSEALRK
ncbi:MAG: F0F1 ATP synthase subunit gamma [Saprospiraceae bacterium]